MFHGTFVFDFHDNDLDVLIPEVEGHVYRAGSWLGETELVCGEDHDHGAGKHEGPDTYTLSGGKLVLNNAFGLISRNASVAAVLSGGTIQAGNGVSPNLDSNKITVAGPVTLDTNGANTFTLYGPLAGTGTVTLTGGGTLRTQDGTGTTLTAAGGGMQGGSLGSA